MVVTTQGATLADRLALKNLPLGTTPAGKNFTLKALHPSEHTIKAARIPGGNLPSVALCADMVETFNLPNDSMQATFVLQPNVAIPGMLILTTPGAGGSTTSDYFDFFNPAFGGAVMKNPTAADINTAVRLMDNKFQQYRITSESVTIELIAPSLTDQGTITAVQYECAPRTIQGSSLEDHSGVVGLQTLPDTYIYPEPILPSQAILGTSAYTAKAREGVYMPLRLTKFKWMDYNDMCVCINQPQSYLDAHIQYYQDPNQSLIFPYFQNNAGLNHWKYRSAVPKLCGSNFGITVIDGVAKNVALRVRLRQVVEITCRPGSVYAPLLEAPLPPDSICEAMYHEISGKMKDAYPASYNDLGTLINAITRIGKSVMPYVDPVLSALSTVPGPIGAVAAGAQKGVKLIKMGGQVIRETKANVRKSRSKAKGAQKPAPKPAPAAAAKK